MGVIETKVFKSGNSAAVRLPADLGFPVGLPVRIEKVGGGLRIVPAADPVEVKRTLAGLVQEIREIWKDAPDHPDRGVRHPIEWPNRATR